MYSKEVIADLLRQGEIGQVSDDSRKVVNELLKQQCLRLAEEAYDRTRSDGRSTMYPRDLLYNRVPDEDSLTLNPDRTARFLRREFDSMRCSSDASTCITHAVETYLNQVAENLEAIVNHRDGERLLVRDIDLYRTLFDIEQD